MSFNIDWYPGRREHQIAMAKIWLAVMTVKAAAWGIISEDLAELARLLQDAEALLYQVLSMERTPVITAKCFEAFKALEAHMRYLKRRYVMSPPLLPHDYVSLGLKPPDTIATPEPVPATYPVITFAHPAPEVIDIYFGEDPSQNDPHASSAWRRFLMWGVLAKEIPPGLPPEVSAIGPELKLVRHPKVPTELPHSAEAKRGKETLHLPGCSAETLFVAPGYKNSKNEVGPMGPIVSVVIA